MRVKKNVISSIPHAVHANTFRNNILNKNSGKTFLTYSYNVNHLTANQLNTMAICWESMQNKILLAESSLSGNFNQLVCFLKSKQDLHLK